MSIFARMSNACCCDGSSANGGGGSSSFCSGRGGFVLDAAYLRGQTVYKNAAKTATLADALAAVAAAKMKKAAVAREASVGCAQRAGKVAPLPWRRSAPGAQSVRLSYDTPTSLEYNHGPVPVGDALRPVHSPCGSHTTHPLHSSTIMGRCL